VPIFTQGALYQNKYVILYLGKNQQKEVIFKEDMDKMKKRMYFLLVTLLLFGTTACGKNADSTQEVITQEQTGVTTAEETEMETTEATTNETVVTDIEITEVTTETETEKTVTEEATEEVTTETAQSAGAITPEEAEALLVKVFGTEDAETGNVYSFGYVNTMTVNGVEYHAFTWGWLIDNHVSKLTDLLVATDGSAIHEGLVVGDDVTVYTETNYVE